MIRLFKKHNNVHKKNLRIYSLDKSVALTKAHCQGCQID